MSEAEYVEKIKKFLLANGFETWEEVIPDQCKNWTLPWRVDLIFFREDIGYIAMEAKEVNSLRSGSIIAKAVEQIKKYNPLTYFGGKKIDRWCMGVSFDKKAHINNRDILEFMRGFLTHYDIEVLEFREYSRWNQIVIGFGSKNAMRIGESPYND